MAKNLDQRLAAANLIKTETIPSANTAPRVGASLEDMDNAWNEEIGEINVTTAFPPVSGYHTAETARNAVLESYRRKGRTITFQTSPGTWVKEQFRGDSTATWLTASNWYPILMSADQDVYNVTNKVPLASGEYYNPTTARNAVPDQIRKLGLGLKYLSGYREIDTLTITGPAITDGNIVIFLNGVQNTASPVIIAGNTAIEIATKIRTLSWPGWTTGGTAGTSVVTFTRTTYDTVSAPTFSSTAGITATFNRTSIGQLPDWIHEEFRGSTILNWANESNWRKIASAKDLNLNINSKYRFESSALNQNYTISHHSEFEPGLAKIVNNEYLLDLNYINTWKTLKVEIDINTIAIEIDLFTTTELNPNHIIFLDFNSYIIDTYEYLSEGTTKLYVPNKAQYAIVNIPISIDIIHIKKYFSSYNTMSYTDSIVKEMLSEEILNIQQYGSAYIFPYRLIFDQKIKRLDSYSVFAGYRYIISKNTTSVKLVATFSSTINSIVISDVNNKILSKYDISSVSEDNQVIHLPVPEGGYYVYTNRNTGDSYDYSLSEFGQSNKGLKKDISVKRIDLNKYILEKNRLRVNNGIISEVSSNVWNHCKINCSGFNYLYLVGEPSTPTNQIIFLDLDDNILSYFDMISLDHMKIDVPPNAEYAIINIQMQDYIAGLYNNIKLTHEEIPYTIQIDQSSILEIMSQTQPFENGALNFYNIIKVRENMYYMYYSCFDNTTTIDNFKENICIAWSIDCLTWNKSIPDGIDEVVTGTNILFYGQGGGAVITGQYVFIDQFDLYYPFKITYLQGNYIYIEKSADGVHFSDKQLICSSPSDTQNVFIPFSDKFVGFVRLRDYSVLREVGIYEINRNLSSILKYPTLISHRQCFYAPSIHRLSESDFILFPTYYDEYQTPIKIPVSYFNIATGQLITSSIDIFSIICPDLNRTNNFAMVCPGLIPTGTQNEYYMFWYKSYSDHNTVNSIVKYMCCKIKIKPY